MTKFPLLCAMMFLQFFVWGAWYVTAGTFVPAMGWEQSTTGWVYSAGPIAAMISPLFLGLIADRFFASQRVLSVMHLFGAVIMLVGTYRSLGSANRHAEPAIFETRRLLYDGAVCAAYRGMLH